MDSKKMKKGEALVKEFNEFLKTIDIPASKNKWEAPHWSTETMELNDNSDLNIDKDLNPNDELLTVGLNFGLKPLAFYTGNEPMGLEVEIIYLFAKAKHYNINLIEINMEERMSLLKEGKIDITGGNLSITDERKEFMIFSDEIYSSGIVLAVRIDSKKELIPIEIRNGNYTVNKNNNVDVHVKFSDNKIKTSSCIFPNYYSDILLINCTINDIEDVNVSKGFEYVNTEDKILLLYNDIETNNFLQANTIIEGHTDIIQESDKNIEIVCKNSNNQTISIIIGSSTLVIAIIYLLRLCLQY